MVQERHYAARMNSTNMIPTDASPKGMKMIHENLDRVLKIQMDYYDSRNSQINFGELE